MAPAPEFRIELGQESTVPCPDCHGISHVIRGFVHDEHGARAVYVAGYTEQNPDHFGTMLVYAGAMGRWLGARAAPRDPDHHS